MNAAIGDDYLDFYGMVDYLVMLKAPGFEKVYEWRQKQEDKLAAAQSDAAGETTHHVAGRTQRFIQHYERLPGTACRRCLKKLTWYSSSLTGKLLKQDFEGKCNTPCRN